MTDKKQCKNPKCKNIMRRQVVRNASGDEVLEKPSAFHRRNYCCRDCYNRHMADKPRAPIGVKKDLGPRICVVCSNKFTRPPGMGASNFHKRTTCGYDCQNKLISARKKIEHIMKSKALEVFEMISEKIRRDFLASAIRWIHRKEGFEGHVETTITEDNRITLSVGLDDFVIRITQPEEFAGEYPVSLEQVLEGGPITLTENLTLERI